MFWRLKESWEVILDIEKGTSLVYLSPTDDISVVYERFPGIKESTYGIHK